MAGKSTMKCLNLLYNAILNENIINYLRTPRKMDSEFGNIYYCGNSTSIPEYFNIYFLKDNKIDYIGKYLTKSVKGDTDDI